MEGFARNIEFKCFARPKIWPKKTKYANMHFFVANSIVMGHSMWDVTMGVVFSQNGAEKQDLAFFPICPIAKGYTRTTHNHRPRYSWGMDTHGAFQKIKMLFKYKF